MLAKRHENNRATSNVVNLSPAVTSSPKLPTQSEILKFSTAPKIGKRERRLLYLRPSCENNGLVSSLESQGWHVYGVNDIEGAERVSRAYDIPVGLVDVRIFENEGVLNRWEKIYLSHNDNKWVALLTKEASANSRVLNLVKHRFHDYHTLPVDSGRLLMTLGHAYGMASLGVMGTSKPDVRQKDLGMVGSSHAMKVFYKDLHKIAGVEAPVLLGGESGTGKELGAYAIHKLSSRSDEPFVAVNCGSIPANLIQSELFGHEKGAFTGAHKSKIGRIESAHNGTIFLDEIGDLPFELQINLLRFLQEQTIERVGGSSSIKVNVRVIAATHVDLEKAVKEGRFREDLYYRLNVLPAKVPRLADRGGDIDVLAQHFFNQFSSEKTPTLKGFSQSALTAMNQHSWPGNVRELINRVRQAMVMSDNRLITAEDLGLVNNGLDLTGRTLADVRAQAEEDVIVSTLQRTRNNISLAASMLQVSRATLYRLMEKYDLQPAD